MFFSEINDIYFSKTKEYMQEVIESYAIGNYRSATVMLYSVAICDIMLKLQELIDMYNDTVAKEILSDIEKIKKDTNQSKSKWEKELLDRVYKRTELLNDVSYTNLNHLFDHRNFCAHPALNEDYELFSPKQEVVIAHIRNILTDILVKPPIFIKNIVDHLSDDLEKRRDEYKNDRANLKTYLNNKYYSKMSPLMVCKVFKALWKFCFLIDDDEHCIANRVINRYAISTLFESNRKELLDYIKKENSKLQISDDKKCVLQFSIFLAENNGIYEVLSDELKHQTHEIIKNNDDIKAISWFAHADLNAHLEYLCSFDSINISTNCVAFMCKYYKIHGLTSSLIDFFIRYFGESHSFDKANERYDDVIEPYLSEFTKEQFVLLIKTINGNNQIYGRWANKTCNTQIVKYAKGVLNDFDFNKYPNFEFDENVLKDEECLEETTEDDIDM